MGKKSVISARLRCESSLGYNASQRRVRGENGEEVCVCNLPQRAQTAQRWEFGEGEEVGGTGLGRVKGGEGGKRASAAWFMGVRAGLNYFPNKARQGNAGKGSKGRDERLQLPSW